MTIAVVGIDLAKRVFQLHGVDKAGQVVLRRKLTRARLVTFLAKLEPCVVGMEACGGAHYWGRVFTRLGHQVKLVSPQFVKPFVKSNKNDEADAEAICIAVSQPHMRFVPMKNVEQQDIQALHRSRQLLIKQRTALVNQTRGLLGEYGIVIPQGIGRLREQLPGLVEDAENNLTMRSRELFAELYEQLRWLDERIAVFDQKIAHVFKTNESCQRLGRMAGVGPMIATALVEKVSSQRRRKNCRLLVELNDSGCGGTLERTDRSLRKRWETRVRNLRGIRGKNVIC